MKPYHIATKNKAKDSGWRHALIRDQKVTKRQYKQWYNGHCNAGKTRCYMLLPPAKKAKGDSVGKDTHTQTMQPDAALGGGIEPRQPIAKNNGDRHQ